jgi:SAM-dependent methyltransferase
VASAAYRHAPPDPFALPMARVETSLRRLRKAGRRAVLIVDPHCGDGTFLLRAARRAMALGFVAIEALGFDRDPAALAAARSAARRCRDPRLGADFRPGAPAASDIEGEPDLVLGGRP